MTELIAFRALQGLGGGGSMVSTMAAIGDVVPPRDRGRYQGFFGAVFGLASVIGPTARRVLHHQPVVALDLLREPADRVLAFGVLAATLPARFEAVHHRVDHLGAVLTAAALSAVVLMSTLGGTTYGWGSPVIIAMAVASVVLLVVFVRTERRVPSRCCLRACAPTASSR